MEVGQGGYKNAGWSKRLQIEKDDIAEHQVQPWTKGELDALWISVYWHGLEN